MKEAAMNNFNFEIRGGVLRNKWSRALQMDYDVKNAYKSCKGYQQQMVFKAKWAKQNGVTSK